ncbi:MULTISPECIES: DUF5065 family protein [Bacillus]|uniref:DUF5065 family protein n=1 Tax=Bacillus TaxID=1386 RepID=UPI00032F9BD1|nr:MULTISPECIES: DUF5065 family protein [Bacillus]EOP29483.1 hypothetical protein IIS_05161 [Bacillus cereus VD131]KAF6547168.1 DUF5065 family protein [Bacillus sp. EKM202B]MBJ8042425.1 DUF5065 family protein [Bacillus cereus group sp. N17]MBJ8067780.1 DUF5065 family protein [Bacillus cereus group sp. N15]MCS3599211.1 hypothetical protein [Bacillus sp. JUb91]
MKLGKLALVGALALGGLTAVGTINTPSASADTVQHAVLPYDDWGITNTGILYEWIEPMPAEYKEHLMPAYETQNWFTVITDDAGLVAGKDQVKIFRVLDNGDLSRYKTIDFHKEWVLPGKAVFDTQITDAYGPGTYVAVSYIHGKHLKSDFFTINK